MNSARGQPRLWYRFKGVHSFKGKVDVIIEAQEIH